MGDERVAIVTGGARGLGLAMVWALLEQDVADRVAVFDLLGDAIDDGRVDVYQCDVTDLASVRSAYAKVGAVPRVLVNNAGGEPASSALATQRGPFEDPEAFRRMVDLNFTSAHIVTSVVGPDMTEGAAICSTASIAGQMATALHAYGAAKAALIHWTKSMSRSLGPRGIRINAVAPGIIRTILWEQMQPDVDKYNEMVAAGTPLLSDQSPEDIADAVVFLCSDKAASITGQTLTVDGGMTMGPPIHDT